MSAAVPTLVENLAEAWSDRANRAATTVMEQERTGYLWMAPLMARYNIAVGWAGYWSTGLGSR